MSRAADAAGSGTFEIASLDTISDGACDAVRAIYEEAFPAHEREPFAGIVAASRDGEQVGLVALEDGRPIGLVFLSALEAVGQLFLEYFAVAAERRGGGIGQALWFATADELEARGVPGSVVLEVEDPAEPGLDREEASKRKRRIRFWEKVGARLLPVDGYLVPKLGEDGVEALLLMWIARPADAAQPPLLDLVVALYESGYGLDPDDPLVARAKDAMGS